MNNSKLRVLRIVNSFGETEPSFKQFSLPVMYQQDISVCSYFSTTSYLPSEIKFYDGHNTIMGFLRALFSALKEQEYDIIHTHYSHVAVISLLLLLFRYPRLLRRTIYTVHTSYPNLKFRNRILTILTFIFYRHIVFCGYSSSSSFPKIYHKLLGKRAHVIQNGVDTKKIDRILTQSHCQKSSEFSIIAVGRLIALKNNVTLLSAIEMIQDKTIKLSIVGDGPERANLEDTVEELGIGNQVTFTGMIKRDEVYHHLCRSNLFISVSYIEGLPIATLEAMTARCLIILSDIGPHQEIVSEHEGVPLVDPDDAEGLANKIKYLKNKTTSEQEAIGEKNRQIVLSQFSVERMLEEYLALYMSI